ncbi:bifunctional folylpolyglutamate synthase/dihydrofolate synthase [Erythrobacteraceae bacterium CFH 75059]|uniref:bifunctional folylpolyglutamate synthase/dihydrofolate synthase n=1 Tax=Qipengyuania thermophila TaxID=2509361 RepID=UPI0010225B67|nr:folylpolyglutamate synthase/dihydrofolate synthase family protein [Qipengyuania thermophila]TCD05405.1 bifunctional folylpolyglutamate synthase/dihydrofolate synthase [Erythrobacteraceae bacterium CFH 75059]
MRDVGRSDDPRVQAQLDRLARLSQPEGRLGLETIRALLARLGDPQDRLPPVFHVAGTNGKGSTCAFLRAICEAQGLRVHATISPHLVRYNERIRLAGALIEDAPLAVLLEEVLDAAEGLAPSFFEATIAAAFLAFARVPADVCIVEVGLGGRLDATNVIPAPAACGIAALGLDHERFLLAPEENTPAHPLARIAFEKAGIAKPGVPLVTLAYGEPEREAIAATASRVGAPWFAQDRDWDIRDLAVGLYYGDETRGETSGLHLPLPSLAGAHQVANAGLAIAMLRHQEKIVVNEAAIARGLTTAEWPARLQRLGPGPLLAGLAPREIWLDGGHNGSAAAALAAHLAGRPVHLIVGMIESKDPGAFVAAFGNSVASLGVVPVPGHRWHDAAAFPPPACFRETVADALRAMPDDGLPVLITGSLYLAGAVLKQNGALPR